MNMLIAVASRHGSTEGIAEVIAGELRAEGIGVDLREAGTVTDLSPYDAVILGSAVYMGHWLPEARRFADEHRETLRSIPVWLFCSGPLGDPPEPVDDSPDLDRFGKDLGAQGCCTFGGRLSVEELGVKERIVLKVVGAPTGDFREWEKIRAWSADIVSALRMASSRAESTAPPIGIGSEAS